MSLGAECGRPRTIAGRAFSSGAGPPILEKDWLTAKTKAVEQLKKDPADPIALRLLGRTLRRLARDQDADAVYGRLHAETMEAEDYAVLGHAYLRAQKTKLATEAWQKACSSTRSTSSLGSASSRSCSGRTGSPKRIEKPTGC